jgi:hypothetical protein
LTPAQDAGYVLRIGSTLMVFPQKIEGPVLARNRKRLRSLDTPNLQFPRISGFIYLPGNYTRKNVFFNLSATSQMRTITCRSLSMKQINKEKMND